MKPLILFVALLISLTVYFASHIARLSPMTDGAASPSLALTETARLASTTIQSDTVELQRPISPDNAGQVEQLAQAGRGAVEIIAWSPDGRVMAVAGTLGIYLYQAETLQDLRLLPTDRPVKLVSFSPDGDQLITGDIDGQIQMWRTDSGQRLYTLAGANIELTQVAFSPDGRLAMGQWWQQQLQVWEAQTGQIVHTFDLTASRQEAILSPDLSTVVMVARFSDTPQWFEVASHNLLYQADLYFERAAFSPEGRTLALAGNELTYLLDTATHQLRHTLTGEFSSFSPDGQLLVGVGADYTLTLWDVNSGQAQRTLEGPAIGANFSPDGQLLISTGSIDGLTRVWEVASGQLLYAVEGAVPFYISPDSRFVASIADLSNPGARDSLEVREARTGRKIQTLRESAGALNGVIFSPDGQRLVSMTQTVMRLWDVDSGQPLEAFAKYWPEGPASPQFIFGQPGQLIVSNAAQTSLWQWETAAGQLRSQHVISGTDSLALSPDGRWLATAAPEHAVQLWDAASGQPLRRFEGHSDAVTGLAFTPAGTRLVSSADKLIAGSGPGGNSELRVWQVETGQLLASHETSPWTVRVDRFISADRLVTTGYIFNTCGRGGGSTEVAVWELAALLSAKGKIEPVWRHSGSDPALSGNGRMLTGLFQNEACLMPGVVYAWDAASGAEQRAISFFDATSPSNNYVTAYAPDPTGTTLAIATSQGKFGLWDVGTGQPSHTFEPQTAGVTSLVYSPDGRLLVSGHRNGQIQLWDTGTRRLLHTLTGHTTRIVRLAFNLNGELLLSSSDDGTVRLWGLAKASK
ncbi:MAG: hypothetical protein DPW09_02125 [Anaerolineae bacterium]|nr:WD40 repeat domain-containing protein [Anaerolineae bacterium]MCQ3972226.1 hypothetical protein [Anaerolineae bacterium]